jgi:3-phosphoglycerate kinase
MDLELSLLVHPERNGDLTFVSTAGVLEWMEERTPPAVAALEQS